MPDKIIVFLVDDDVIYLKTLQHNLHENLVKHFVFKTFPTGEAALTYIKTKKTKPSIVVLDYYLNSVEKTAKDGIEILKELKKIDKHINVIMLSVEDNLEIANKCVNNGAYDYVIKSESAFVKTINIINNIYKNVILKNKLKAQKMGFIIFGIIVSLLVILVIYFYFQFGMKM